ncbi:MAG: Uma2 family endonuclease [Gemmataceae bacterium]
MHSGDQLAQPEFHLRYEAYPEDAKFELIGGVVHMASPMRGPHGLYTSELHGLFFLYKVATPGVEAPENITTILGPRSEPQPDLMLRLQREYGGQSDYDEDQYLRGAPELVAEVAHSTVALDMHGKRDDYLAAGVLEYVVLCVAEGEIHWHHFPSKRKLKPDRAGVYKSRAFPGLWLDGPALIARDSARLIATLQRGLASPQHAEFIQTLEGRRGK